MNNVQIQVYNGATYLGVIDVEDNITFPLALTYTLTDIREPEKKKGAFSKTFKVPATKNNNAILKHIYYVTVEQDDALTGLDCRIMVSGVVIAVGLLRAEKSKQKLDPTEYELNFLGTENGWAQQLKEKNIRDYDYTNPLQPNGAIQSFTKYFVEESWDGSYDSGWDYVYPLVNYGAWSGFDDSTSSYYARIEDFRPWVYVKGIIEKAFTDIGYTVVSDFFDTDEFKGLILNTDRFIISPDVRELNQATISNSTDLRNNITEIVAGIKPVQFDTISDPYGFITNDNVTVRFANSIIIQPNIPVTIFQPDSSGIYEVTINGAIYQETTILIYQYNSVEDYYEEYTTIFIADEKTTGGGIVASQFPVNSTHIFEAEANGKYILVLTNEPHGASGVQNGAIVFADTTFQFKQGETIKKGTNYDLAYTLPDLTPLQILQGLNKMFNLYYRTVIDTRTVYIEPRDSFYKSNPNAKDWSRKLDIQDIEIEFPKDTKRELIFNFKEDNSDGFLEERNEREGEVLGEQKVTLPLKFSSGEKKMQTDYAYTTFIRDERISIDGNNSVEIPRLWSDYEAYPEFKDDWSARVMYYKGNVEQFEGAEWRIESEQAGALFERVDTVPFATMNDSSFNLNFNGTTGLVNTYWRNEIGTIVLGRIVVTKSYLNSTDLANLDLRFPIYLDKPEIKGYFYIQSIKDYKPTRTDLTEIELIPVVEYYSLDDLQEIVTREINEKIGARLAGNSDTGVWIENMSFGDSYAEKNALALGDGVKALEGMTVIGSYNKGIEGNKFEIGVGNSNTRVNGFFMALNDSTDPTKGVTGDFNGGRIYTSTGCEITTVTSKDGNGNPTNYDKVYKTGE